jgi:hypothetical protein
LEVAASHAGERVLCPKCGNNLQIPGLAIVVQPTINSLPTCATLSPQVPDNNRAESTANEILDLVPANDEDAGPLTPCAACGRSIAKQAVTCPGCGAPNTWTHSEILRFYRSIHRFKFESSVKLEYHKYLLTGVDHKESAHAESIAALANRIGIIGSLGDVVAADFGRQWLNQWARRKIKAFRIDFATLPPTWDSTDDEWWIDVKAFFGLHPRRRRRRLPPPLPP